MPQSLFQFLIENGANIHTPQSGLDALDVTLQWFDLQGNSTTYLSTLINSGLRRSWWVHIFVFYKPGQVIVLYRKF
jgi:hypothetical protein